MSIIWTFFAIFVFCGQCFCESEVFSVLKDIQGCFNKDLDVCLKGYATKALVDFADIGGIYNETVGRSLKNDDEDIEDLLIRKLSTEFGLPDFAIDFVESARRANTFHRPWKYLVPLLIGVKLKLAAFVPLVLVALTIIAKSAIISGNLAVLLTGLNIALKYWYPKWSEEHHVYHGHAEQAGYRHENYGEPGVYHGHEQAQYDGHPGGYPNRRRVVHLYQ